MHAASGEIVSCNPAAKRILGLSPDQMAGRASLDPGWRAIHEDGSPFPGESHPAMLTIRTGEAIRNVVMGIHTPGGSLRLISINSEPVSGAGQLPASVVATFVDITDRRLADEAARKGAEAIRRSGEDFRLHFENSVVGTSLTSPTGEVRVNDALARMLGYEKDEPAQLRWQDVTHPDDVDETRRQMAALLASQGDSVRYEKRFLRKDGFVVWAEIISSIRRDASGTLLYFMTTALDISEQRRAEEALRASEERYRRIVETTHEGIWLTDSEHKTIFVNPRMADILGYGAEEMLGASVFSFVDEKWLPEWKEKIERRNQQIGEVREFPFRKKDGSEVWALVSEAPFPLKEGGGVGSLAMVTDITGRKRIERRLLFISRAVESSSDAIGISDGEGHHVFHNRAMSVLFGYSTPRNWRRPEEGQRSSRTRK